MILVHFRTLSIIVLLAVACKNPNSGTTETTPPKPNEYMNESGFRDLVDRFEAPDRNEWQCPDLIMDQLGPLTDKKVMDLGAGTGYFTVRFVDAGASVIAADVDQRFLDFLANRARGLGYTEEQLELRRVPYDNPSLSKGEVDIFFTCNTYHHIENRENYFKQVKTGLAPGGLVAIVDFHRGGSKHGPPPNMRVPADVMRSELAAAGFRRIKIDSSFLPEQVLVLAWP